MKKVMLIGLMSLSACAGSASMGERAELSGSPEALRAMGEIMAALVSEGKATPDKRGAYWQQREKHEAELTTRATSGGFFSKVFNGTKEPK
jgi:hypothetical protein